MLDTIEGLIAASLAISGIGFMLGGFFIASALQNIAKAMSRPVRMDMSPVQQTIYHKNEVPPMKPPLRITEGDL